MNRFHYVKEKYPGVFLLGYISFFADVASEMLYPITPLFLTSIIGASMTNVGMIEGIAEGVSSFLKTYSGYWSDRISRRKPFIIVGYFISAISRPMIGASSSVMQVLLARSTDRVGKGIRTAPRDALLADWVDQKDRGLAFGWHRLMDTMGAFLGPLLALLLLAHFTDLRQIYYLALIPGLLSVACVFFIKEPRGVLKASKIKNLAKKIKIGDLKFNPKYRLFVLGWTVFCLTNASDAFLILKMKDAGVGFTGIILIYSFYNLVYAGLSPTLGQWSDRLGAKKVLMLGMIMFILTYAGFAFSTAIYQFVILFAFYGVYMAATDGVGKAYATQLVSQDYRASALGVMGTLAAAAQIFASIAVGLIWDQHGALAAILFNCIGSIMFLVILMMNGDQKNDSNQKI